MKHRTALAALFTSPIAITLLYGCAVTSPQQIARSTALQSIATTVESSACKLDFSVSVGCPAPPAPSTVCTITLKNSGDDLVEIPDLDIGKHLSVFVRLVDDQGTEAPLSDLGQDQFHNFSASFVQSRGLKPGESLTWRLELEKTFIILPSHNYTVHAIYACHNTSRLPDIELAGIRFQGE